MSITFFTHTAHSALFSPFLAADFARGTSNSSIPPLSHVSNRLPALRGVWSKATPFAARGRPTVSRNAGEMETNRNLLNLSSLSCKKHMILRVEPDFAAYRVKRAGYSVGKGPFAVLAKRSCRKYTISSAGSKKAVKSCTFYKILGLLRDCPIKIQD